MQYDAAAAFASSGLMFRARSNQYSTGPSSATITTVSRLCEVGGTTYCKKAASGSAEISSGSTFGTVRNFMAIAFAVRSAPDVQATIRWPDTWHSLSPLMCAATASVCRPPAALEELACRTSTTVRPLSLWRSGPPPAHSDKSAPPTLCHVKLSRGMWPAAPTEMICIVVGVPGLPPMTSTRVKEACCRWNNDQAIHARSMGTPAARISKYKMMLL
mmetsp:Transcript_55870/g.100250  ORF Transcript_55870/g.100250 Transcript_55870/m.100250 type:complete len:216 (+) Transcript_55870:195-842(+)